MPTYMFHYFEGRGRAESIRYIFYAANLPFEDIFVARDQWPAMKPKTVMGQLPFLEVDGKQLCQSVSIGRFLARETGLAGKNSFEMALADMYVDGISDMFTAYRPVIMATFSGDKEKEKQCFKEFQEGALKTFLDRYDKFLSDNGSGFFVGNALTWADLYVAEHMNRFMVLYDPEVLKGHPKLADHCKRIHDLPGIKKYVATRKAFAF